MDLNRQKTDLIAVGFFLSGIIIGFISSWAGNFIEQYSKNRNALKLSGNFSTCVTYLDSLNPIASAGFETPASDIQDTMGNQYIKHNLTIGDFSWATNDNGYAIYYLGGTYKTLSGTIAMQDQSQSEKTGEVSILCDNHVIYTTGTIDRLSTPIIFSTNIENCQWLKISQTCYTGLNIHIKFILHNWKLE